MAELGVPAAVPLNLTALFAAVVLKLVPAIVTVVPTGPLVGEKLDTVGGTVTVNVPLLVAVEPLTVTAILPVVAPLGTATTSVVVVADETVALVPLNLTVLLVFVALKFVPEIVTDVPTGPELGVKPLIVGAAQTAVADSEQMASTHWSSHRRQFFTQKGLCWVDDATKTRPPRAMVVLNERETMEGASNDETEFPLARRSQRNIELQSCLRKHVRNELIISLAPRLRCTGVVENATFSERLV